MNNFGSTAIRGQTTNFVKSKMLQNIHHYFAKKIRNTILTITVRYGQIQAKKVVFYTQKTGYPLPGFVTG